MQQLFADLWYQSICTLIFNLSGGPDIFLGSGTEKKKPGPKYGPEKNQGAKNRVIVIQKEKRQPGLFLFLRIVDAD